MYEKRLSPGTFNRKCHGSTARPENPGQFHMSGLLSGPVLVVTIAQIWDNFMVPRVSLSSPRSSRSIWHQSKFVLWNRRANLLLPQKKAINVKDFILQRRSVVNQNFHCIDKVQYGMSTWEFHELISRYSHGCIVAVRLVNCSMVQNGTNDYPSRLQIYHFRLFPTYKAFSNRNSISFASAWLPSTQSLQAGVSSRSSSFLSFAFKKNVFSIGDII